MGNPIAWHKGRHRYKFDLPHLIDYRKQVGRYVGAHDDIKGTVEFKSLLLEESNALAVQAQVEAMLAKKG